MSDTTPAPVPAEEPVVTPVEAPVEAPATPVQDLSALTGETTNPTEAEAESPSSVDPAVVDPEEAVD